MLIKNSYDSDWQNWKYIFCNTFADKRWTPVNYTFDFKYVNGALLEYDALKAENHLLEINKSVDKFMLIDLFNCCGSSILYIK